MSVITLGGVTLPADLAWPDRYTWQSVDVSQEYSLTGAVIVQSSEKQAGRPITLESQDTRAWVERSVVDELKALQAVAGATYTLSVRSETYTVTILSVTADPLWDFSDNSDTCSLRLQMIEM